MIEFLLIIIIAQLAYMISIFKNKSQTDKKTESALSYQSILPEYLNKKCEIALKKPLIEIDIMYSITGTILDLDEKWIMLETDVKKKKVLKMIRIENINSIIEIV